MDRVRIASTDRKPLAHSDDSSATLLCHNRGQDDTEAMSVDVSLATVGDTVCVSRASCVRSRRPSCFRRTCQPDAGIMPHGGKSCQGQTAFRPDSETPATRRRGRNSQAEAGPTRTRESAPRPGERVQSYPSGSLRESVRSARAGRLTGQGPGVRISRLQQWPPRRGRQWAVASSLASRSNTIPCLLQLNGSCSIDGAT